MLTKLTGLAQPMNDVTTARAAVKAAEAAAAQAEVLAKKVLADAKRDLMSYFSSDPSKLALFGLSAPKARTPLTTAQKVQRSVKAAATREARGTKGPKARLAIKANPAPPTTVVVDDTGLHVVPAAEPAASSPASAGAVEPAVTVSATK